MRIPKYYSEANYNRHKWDHSIIRILTITIQQMRYFKLLRRSEAASIEKRAVFKSIRNQFT